MRETLKRIERLEARTQSPEPRRVIRQIIEPGRDFDPRWARGNGVELRRQESESAEAFTKRAMAEIHGRIIMRGDHARAA